MICVNADASECTNEASRAANPLSLQHSTMRQGLPLCLNGHKTDRALEACSIIDPHTRASLRLLRILQAEQTSSENHHVALASRRLGAKLKSHLDQPLACCSGAFPRWCSELPILAPWLFPLDAREALLRCTASGVTFAVRWLQERSVDERFAERRRTAEERLAQAKHIADAALLNSAYENLFELQGQIARDSEAWVGALKSELVRCGRENILQQAECAMELTKSSPCVLEVQFQGEGGFGRAVTQGFYTLVAHELQRRTTNRELPMWVEDDPPLNEDFEFLQPRRGLLVRPLSPDFPRWSDLERRFCMLGRLMAKALRESFVVPLPLTSSFFELLLGTPIDPVSSFPRPGDGVAGEFVGACAALIANAESGPHSLTELAEDPEWSRKYVQAPGEEQVVASTFADYADHTVFVETGLWGAPLCEGGESRAVSVSNVTEFVERAADFWFRTGVERQMIAFRSGLYDILGHGAISLWSFSASELQRLICGEDEVTWTEDELAKHLHCGGGFSSDSDHMRWFREELLEMAAPLRAKFLEFVTSCPRLPPGGLSELQLSIHPDPADNAGLPRSRACAHRLFLPRYSSREELSRRLHEAILGAGGHDEQQLPL